MAGRVRRGRLLNIGQNRGATRSNLVLGKESVEFAERIVDARGGLKFFGLAGKGGGEIGEFAVLLLADGVTEAETGSGVTDGKAATAATRGAMLTMKMKWSRADFGDFGIHVGSFPTGAGMFHFGKS
jgi:hypothetical protein